MVKKCVVCDGLKDLSEIKGTNTQYDGSYVCKGCISNNQDAYESNMRDDAIINSFGN